MARKPREVYTREEVEVMLHNVHMHALNTSVEKLLSTGAKPDAGVGMCLMDFAAESKNQYDFAAMKSEHAKITPERAEQLGAVLNEHFGNRARS